MSMQTRQNRDAGQIASTAWDMFETIKLHHPKGIDADFVEAFAILTAYITTEAVRVTGITQEEVIEDMNKLTKHYLKVMDKL